MQHVLTYNYGKSPTPGDGEFGKRGLMPHPDPGGGVGHFIDTRISRTCPVLFSSNDLRSLPCISQTTE